MNTKEHTLIVLVGPTAIGKTSLSIQLAKHFKCEILSADSRQFYKEMSIGTAKPTKEEMAGIPHHFVDILHINEFYSAGKFEKDALNVLDTLFKKDDVAILVGGSGMYVNTVCNGIDEIPSDLSLRDQLNKELEVKGIEALQQELLMKDPEHYKSMDINNPQRLIRAVEVCRVSGKTYTSFRKLKKKPRPFNIVKIGINAERDLMYDRINRRVDIMVNNGLIAEVESLLEHKDLNALNTVGYKEFWPYFEKTSSLEDCIAQLKQNTRRFAKRQMTWFKKDTETTWFDFNETKNVLTFLEEKLND